MKTRKRKAAPAPPADEECQDTAADLGPCAHAFEVKESKVAWLLPGFLPLGACCVLEGRKEVGKSSVAAAIAAAVAGGPALPGGRRRRLGSVVWYAGEEHVPSTTIPKLRCAEAPLHECYFPGWDTRGRYTRPWTFPLDLGRLENLMRGVACRLVVFDPFSSFVAPGLNLCVEQEARHLLDQLGRLAADVGACMLLQRHLRKGTGGHLHDAGLGSIAIGAAARAIVRVDHLDARPGRRVMRPVACNVGPAARPLTFDLVAGDGAARVVWRGTIDRDDPRLDDETPDPGERDAMEDARRFLVDALTGEPQAAKQLTRRAEEACISRATLRRAKKALAVQSFARGNRSDRVWYWKLPRS